jgi:hypothetical protein
MTERSGPALWCSSNARLGRAKAQRRRHAAERQRGEECEPNHGCARLTVRRFPAFYHTCHLPDCIALPAQGCDSFCGVMSPRADKKLIVNLDLSCRETEQGYVLLSRKFVGEVLLCFSEIELVDQEKLVSTALLEFSDQKRI